MMQRYVSTIYYISLKCWQFKIDSHNMEHANDYLKDITYAFFRTSVNRQVEDAGKKQNNKYIIVLEGGGAAAGGKKQGKKKGGK